MKFSNRFNAYISDKICISWSIRLEPSLLIDDINRYLQQIKYQLSMEAWKNFKSEGESIEMYVRLITPGVYDFSEEFKIRSIQQAGIQIESTADRLCLKIAQRIALAVIYSNEFRALKIATDDYI